MNLLDKLTDVARCGHFWYDIDAPTKVVSDTLKGLGYYVETRSPNRVRIKWDRASETRRQGNETIHKPLPKVSGMPNALDLRQIATFMRRPQR